MFSALLPSGSIQDVEFKLLKTHADSRGFFRELIRFNDPFFSDAFAENPFAQWSHSKMAKNTIKAWHFHHVQSDWWYLPIGVIETVLFDLREESPTYKNKLVFRLGESELDSTALAAVVCIPPGVAHGCKVLTEYAHLFYITSETYNPDDEGRHPYNSSVVPHDWNVPESEAIVAPNDKRTFIPKNPRKHLTESI